jgi:solute carrier family 35 protein F5
VGIEMMNVIDRQYFIGIVFILLCACLWAGSSVLIQYIYSDLSFNSPFLLTYLATSLLSLHLPYFHGKEWIKRQYNSGSITFSKRTGSQYGRIEDSRSLIGVSSAEFCLTEEKNGEDGSNVNISDGDQYRNKYDDLTSTVEEYASDYEVLKPALIIAPIWFLANCLYNYSLLMTTVSSSTVISNLSAAFTLLFAAWLRLESASYVKIIGVVICFVGAITTGLADSKGGGGPADSVGGDVIAVLGAAGYGLYTTTIRYLVPEDESGGSFNSDSEQIVNAMHFSDNKNADITTNSGKKQAKPVSMHLLLGYIGLVNAVTLAPIVGIMFAVHWSGITGISGKAVGFVCANGIADTVIADYFWARAVLLTSPTVATIGMSITIPIALITDYFVDGISPHGISVFGALLVVVGFVLVNLTNSQVMWFLSFIRERVSPSS